MSQLQPVSTSRALLIGLLLLASGAASAVDPLSEATTLSLATSRQQLGRLTTFLTDANMDRQDRLTVSRWMKEAARQLTAAETIADKNPMSSDRHLRKARRLLDRAEKLVTAQGGKS